MADKQTVLAKLNVRAFFQEAIPTLKANGKTAEATGLCPFHSDHEHPNFHVNLDNGKWKCWACSAAGSVFDFVMRREGLTFPEARDWLARYAGRDPARGGPERQRDNRNRDDKLAHDFSGMYSIWFGGRPVEWSSYAAVGGQSQPELFGHQRSGASC